MPGSFVPVPQPKQPAGVAPTDTSTVNLPPSNWIAINAAGETVQQKDNRITGFLLDPNLAENPPFDQRMQNVGHIQGRMPRGRITMLNEEPAELLPGIGKKQRSCNFLFNPQQIAQSYQFSQYVPLQPSQDDQSAVTATGQSLRFQLMFDRTFELAYPDPGNIASQIGVLADIGAYENIARANFGRPATAVPVIVSFGVLRTGQPWSFYGWITQFDVTYTQFNVHMIPQRATVDTTLTRLYWDPTTGDASGWTPSPRSTTVTRPDGTIEHSVA